MTTPFDVFRKGPLVPYPRRGLAGALLAALLLVFPGSTEAQELTPDEIEGLVEEGSGEAFALYRELLSLPNDAHHPDDILRLLEWLEGAFGQRGFETERLPTDGSPVLLARRAFTGRGPTVLVYLQADGQPVDPAAWNQESPWRPVLKERGPDGSWREIPWSRLEGASDRERDPEWRIFARSASDSKGPIAQLLSALDALDRAGVEPELDLKVIVDTEEEQGSPNLAPALERFRDELAADMLVIFDGPPHASGRPTLKFGARGIALVTLTTYGPRVPQHSGHYGNYAPNPAIRLAEIIASFKNDEGRVDIPGWYDGITMEPEVREMLAAVPDDEDRIMRELGIAERDRVGGNLQESVQYPSLNVRGMRSGWVGDEARTIVPATATAEIDVRLVAESDPERLLGLLRERIEGLGYRVLDARPPTEEERLSHPKLVTMESRVAYGAFRTDFESRPGRWLRRALTRLHGHEPILIRTSGGSIPIAPFVSTLGVPAVSVPTVNPDNNQHSPDENLRVGSFLEGIRVMAAVLAEPLGAGSR